MSVTRSRAEAIKKAEVRRGGHTSMGLCPICEKDITTNQKTAHRLVEGVPTRIHASHLASSD